MDKITPEIICEIYDESGVTGYLVIDSIINNNCWGGIRTVPDLTIDELIQNARTMTMKYGFLGLPVGGAKAGVIINGEDQEKRKNVFRRFGKKIAPLLKNKIYLPGIDLGTTLDDLKELERGAGVNLRLNKWKDVSHIYTSWTIYAAAEETLKITGIRNGKVAIEGFGKVGSEVAKIFSENGFTVVGVSNKLGAIYKEEGLDIDTLIRIKDRYKDGMIFKYPDTAKIENHELYYLPVDILVFCGRSFVAETLAIEKIKAKIICVGVNAPLTERFEEALFEKGQICLPDFVSNSGGVLGSLMRHYMSDNKIEEIFKSDYSKKVRRLLSRSQETRTLPGKVARIMVEERIKFMKQESRKIGLSRFLKPLVPEFFKRPFAKRYFTKMMDS